MTIFISYRREDSAGHTGRLYDTLRARFGDGNVFLDVSGIDSGRKFTDVIQNAIRSCDVLLAVIGPEWLTCQAAGKRRIDDPGDLVRAEILAAFAGNIPVIPVLVGGASPPPAAALPGPLKPLAALDAHDMTDERWTYDSDRLVQAIRNITGVSRAPVRRPFRQVAALLTAVLVVAAFLVWRGDATAPAAPGSPGVDSAASSTSAPAGEWEADVAYEWGAKYTERLTLRVDGTRLTGTASFLGIPRAIVSGSVDGDRLTFETRTQEVTGDFNQPRDVIHRYHGRVAGTTLAISMQREGSGSQQPVEFVATRPRR